MINSEFTTLTIEWSDNASVSEELSPDNFIYEIEGQINITDDNHENCHVGNFTVIYVDVFQAMNSDFDLGIIMDRSQRTWDYYESLFDGYDLNETIVNMFDEPIFKENLLILDRLEILPEYRGKKLGLKAMNLLIRRFSQGASIVALKAFPLQFESGVKENLHADWNLRMGYGNMQKNEKMATSNLYKYYGKLGFQRVKKTQYMVLNVEQIIPSC